MKRSLRLPLAALLLTLIAAPAFADGSPFPTPAPSWSDADWQTFSDNLVASLAGENDGVKASALQMIIRYGDRLDVQDATFDVVRLYRDHKDDRMRRLAAVACPHLGNRWAMSFLRMSEPFERSPALQHTIRALIAEDAHKGTVETGQLQIIAGESQR